MRTSQYLLSTLKEIPNNTEVISHQLMLRAGMIRSLASGLYIWLPTGLRVLRKIENIVRKEMNNIGAIEVSMPIMQPKALWQESGRWIEYGSELLWFTDRNKRSFALGPTHEEVITHLIRNEIKSYKKLPLNLYQIQTKFRDEIRPRFGVIRSREFIMKDAYSFHTSQDSLQMTYDTMYCTYNTILNHIGLKFCVVKADTGSIGGNLSHEFQAITNNREDKIVSSTKLNYSTNVEFTEVIKSVNTRPLPKEKMRIINIPEIHNISELSTKFSLPLKKIVKTLLVHANKDIGYPLVALILRCDHQLSNFKAEKLPQVAVPIKFASEEEIQLLVGTNSHSIGPVNLILPLIIDHSVAMMSDFISGANIKGKYFFGINWERDLPLPQVADIREFISSNISPNTNNTLQIKHGIEVAHIFQLGTKYSKIMKTTVQGKEGINQTLIMGCYGIGITRIVAATIEQNHDERGILWPEVIAPFSVVILPINMHKSLHVKEVAEKLYLQLKTYGIDVLIDDRKECLGVMFADMELIGIPHQLIISSSNLNINKIEYKNRQSNEKQLIELSLIINFITSKISIKN